MRPDTQHSSTAQRLVAYILDGTVEGPVADELYTWSAGSPRFRAFTETHRDKMRKKIRSAQGGEALRDVRAELRAAQLLLADRRMELAFEAYGSTRGGPDFTVRFRGERPFNCEVTRLRRAPAEVTDGGPLLAKLRQLPPSMPNLLVIAIDGTSAAALDVDAATQGLRRRADAEDESFFVRRGFSGRRDFYARFLRLSGVVVWCEGAVGESRAYAWANPSARIALPDRAVRACLACLRGAGDPL